MTIRSFCDIWASLALLMGVGCSAVGNLAPGAGRLRGGTTSGQGDPLALFPQLC